MQCNHAQYVYKSLQPIITSLTKPTYLNVITSCLVSNTFTIIALEGAFAALLSLIWGYESFALHTLLEDGFVLLGSILINLEKEDKTKA